MQMKPNKVFLEFLITLSLLFMPIAISENVYASESDVRMWCMNIPLTRTFQSPYAFIHKFIWLCIDKETVFVFPVTAGLYLFKRRTGFGFHFRSLPKV